MFLASLGEIVIVLRCYNVLEVAFFLNFFEVIFLQLPQISDGGELLDMVVIGCGPAGLALAAESAKLGLKVGLVGPDLPFTNNYGVWEDEFKGTTSN